MANNLNEKIAMKFNISQLDRIIIALLNKSHNKKFASNVKRIFSIFQEDSYQNDMDKEVRVYIIKKLTEAIIDKKISKKETLLSFLDLSGKYEDDAVQIINSLFEMEIEDREVELLDTMVSQYLKYSIITDRSTMLADLITNLQTENYDDFDSFIGEFQDSLEVFSKDVRSARESIENSKYDVNLGSDSFVNILDKMIQQERNPATKIKTGIRAINTILDGGWAPSRLYVALAMAKGGKSLFLLNSAIWAIKYNQLQPKKEGLKPVVVYLTMENTTDETIQRIWNHSFGNDSKISSFEPAVAARMLEEQKVFTPNKPDTPELIIWYRSNKSINTADLNGMLDDLEKDGKECVFLVVDYLKRIRSTSGQKELRLELSAITDELAAMTKEREIPILTAMQLNREAFRDYESSSTMEGQITALERMGAHNVGESIDIIQNCDMAFILGRIQNPQYGENDELEYNDRYMIFKLIASRFRSPKIVSFKHRFKDGNDLALIEDLNMAQSISVLTTDDLIKDKLSKNGQKTRGPRSI